MPKGYNFTARCLIGVGVFLLLLISFPSAFGQGFSLLHQKEAQNGSIGGLGWSVAIVGDVDGDGKADFIVGAPQSTAPGGHQGIAFVYSGATGALIYQNNGAVSGDRFGFSVAGAGDVNGDGRADFIVGAPGADIIAEAGPGKAYVYSGANDSLLYEINAGTGVAALGWSVAGAGDVNGDGKADFIVGAPNSIVGGFDGGSAFVYSGIDGALLYRKDGGFVDPSHLDYLFGGAVAGAGDVNGDDTADFIIGAPKAFGATGNSARAYVFSGANGSLLYYKPGAFRETFANSVAGAGDVDGDGNDDIIIGETGGWNNLVGSAYVYSGDDGVLLYQKNGVAPGDKFGRSVAGTGDVNGDGRADFIVGSPQQPEYGIPPTGTGPGVVYLYSGLDGSLLAWKDGTITYPNGDGGRLGYSVGGAVAGVGQDVDGDGKDDFIIGGPSESNGPAGTGSAYVYALDNRDLTLNSTTESRLLLAPAGNVAFEITLRDSSGLPVDSSTNAWLDFSGVTGLTLCPSQYAFHYPLIGANSPSDANGKIQFSIKAGGCTNDSVKVMTVRGMIAKVPIKSLDHNGGLIVTAQDFVGDTCNDYNNDGVTDINDWNFFEKHLGETCVDCSGNFTTSSVYTVPGPDAIFQGDTIQLCVKVLNLLNETAVLDSVNFLSAHWGISRFWTKFAQLTGDSVGPRDSIILCQPFVVPEAHHGCFQVYIYPRYPGNTPICARAVQVNRDAIKRPRPLFGQAISRVTTAGLLPFVNQDTAVFEIPVGTEFGSNLQLSVHAFLPAGWSYTLSDTSSIVAPDTITVKIAHDDPINPADTGRVFIHAYNGSETFAGYAEIFAQFVCTAAKGDMNASADLSPADVVLMLNCVFLASGNCGLCFADVNCSGDLTPADVVIELNGVFLGASQNCGP